MTNASNNGSNPAITNVFVLMLENHSFDNIFAFSGIQGIIAANPTDQNQYNGTPYPVICGAPVAMTTDPGHEFLDVVEQLTGNQSNYSAGNPYPAINNSGFASNYATTTSEGKPPAPANIGDIMACFDTPNELPVLYQLATEFAICDQWFSSLPGPTWPNRFFLHGASSSGLDDSPTSAETALWVGLDGFTYANGSIFDALNTAAIPWRIYNDNKNQFSDDPQNANVSGALPQVASLKGITLLKVNSLGHFAADLLQPYPYKYTFIEPNYGDLINNSYSGGSSQHPMDDVAGAEGLVKFVYESIRNSPLWESSLLVIIYDEHGGFYDSVAPGPAPAPADGSSGSLSKHSFNFDQYGLRVPAIIVSPLIPQNTVDHTLYDHSSVLATVETLFGLSSLTQRDAQANNLLSLLSLASPRTDCPASLNPPAQPMAAKPVLSDVVIAAKDLQPLPDKGNLSGFLHVALKTDYEMSGQTPADKAAVLAKFRAMTTRGDARAYIRDVMTRAEAVKGPAK